MSVSRASIATTDGSRLIKRLLTHWGHRFEVRFDAATGHVSFDADTRAEFHAGAEALTVRIDASDRARLERMQEVVAEHLQRMARGETLQIDWHTP